MPSRGATPSPTKMHDHEYMSQSAQVLRPDDETRYGLAEASRLTGLPLSRFRYPPNKERLIDAGATVGTGGWSIPESALEAMGWSTVNTPVNTPTKPGVKRGSKRGSKSDNATDQSPEDALVEQLRSENTYLRQQLAIQTQTAADLSRAQAVIAGQLSQLESASQATRPAEPGSSWFSKWKHRNGN